MKQFFAAILANFLLLPMCGSVLTFSVYASGISTAHHSNVLNEQMDDTPETTTPHAMVTKNSAYDQSNLGDAPTLNCCNSSQFGSHSGTLKTRPTEKLLKAPTAYFFTTDTTSGSDISVVLNHQPTAPPFLDKRSYTNLVGIIKNLS